MRKFLICIIILIFFTGCKSFKRVNVENQPDECNDFYYVLEYYSVQGGDSAFVGTVYEKCSQARKDKDKAEIKLEEYEPKYIDRMVRAFIPWPITWIVLPESNNENLSKKTMKIYKAELTKGKKIIMPGMLWTDGRDVYVSTKEEGVSLKLIDFQIEGRNRMGGREFLNGVGRFIPKN